MVIDLSRNAETQTVSLAEISGRPNIAQTLCTLRRDGSAVCIEVHAEDPDMLSLISSISPTGTDDFLCEEDCLQVALCPPGSATATDFLLINPHNTRKGTPAALNWPAQSTRHATGWTLSLTLPMPKELSCIGLCLHRFFRGINHEVHGLTRTLPHPLDPSQFAVLVLQGDSEPQDVAAVYRKSVSAAATAAREALLTSLRRRIACGKAAQTPKTSLETARAFALRRAEIPPPIAPAKTMWNEPYLQHALMDLWQLERDRQWLEMAMPRLEATLAARSDRCGNPDPLRRTILHTWHGERSEPWVQCLVTGVLLWPIARFLRIVHDDPALSDLWERARAWLPACSESIAAHDSEWVELRDGGGMYIEPYPKGPRRVYLSGGSRLCPLNRAFALAVPMLHLGRILGRQDYLDKVAAMARYFVRSCERLDNGSLVWEYLTGRYPSTGEDISHASMQVLFAEALFAERIVIEQDFMEGLAATLEKNVFRYGDVPCGDVRGCQPELSLAVGAWAGLCRFVPAVFARIVDVVDTVLAEGKFDFATEGWGSRILTLIEKARWMMETKQLHAPTV